MKRLLVLGCVLAGRVASAQPTPPPDDAKAKADQAAALYDEGKRHFDIAEYAAAIATWKQAYLLSSEPLLLFNIAQAYRLADDCAEANRFYLNYKRLEPKPANQAELTKAMEKCANVEPATGDASDGKTVVGTKPPRSPGPPVVGGGAHPPPPPPHDARDPGARLRLGGYVMTAVGGVAGAIAVVSAMSASSKSSAVQDQAKGTVWSPALQSEQADGQSAATRAKVFTVVAAGAVITGGVLWWLGRRESSVRVEVAIAPRETEVTLSCAF